MSSPVEVSIIIPFGSRSAYIEACLRACLNQTFSRFEILILPDNPINLANSDPRVRIIPTGPISPAQKRNQGASMAQGVILAFIDDDTRPHRHWLSEGLRHFDNLKLGAVGGPALTPSDDPFWARVGGAAYASWLLSGPEVKRYRATRREWIDDYPSCNLFVRRSAFNQVQGFRTDTWPGEDTALCLDLVQAGYRILYEPEASIDHHRRPSLSGHLQQLGRYALHRGYFARHFPQTSRRFAYFVPTLTLILGASLAVGGFTQPAAWDVLASLSIIYLILAWLSLSRQPIGLRCIAIFVIFLSHLTYGLLFIKGLLISKLPDPHRTH